MFPLYIQVLSFISSMQCDELQKDNWLLKDENITLKVRLLEVRVPV